MLRGLDGRRIAIIATGQDHRVAEVVRQALQHAGAEVDVLGVGSGSDEQWHGGKYAGLVAVSGAGESAPPDARVVQLIREFLASEKPVAGFGAMLPLVLEAGGAALEGKAEPEAFAAEVVRDFTRLLDERDVDAMSEQSFPASDPPATSPSSVGHIAPEHDADAQR